MPEPYVTNWSSRPSWCAIRVPIRYSNLRSTMWAKTDAACPAFATVSVATTAVVSGDTSNHIRFDASILARGKFNQDTVNIVLHW
jgi:hypothetical protein